MNKKTLFSGVQPTGNLHLGNYLGAISQWAELQHDYQPIFCVVDYHALTLPQNSQDFQARIIEVARAYLAAGIDPAKSIVFRQSDIKEHTELAWILNCASARMSDLENMTQYKDKASGQANVGVGLFDYPVLMAADILLYDTDIVPVGHDQLQHIELTRDLAKRFNHAYGNIFKIPEALIRQEGARIMGLDDPTKKMSKSAASEHNYIGLSDSLALAKKKIMRATTDSDTRILLDWNLKPGISNLLTIFSLLSGRPIKKLEAEFSDKSYGDFKKALADTVTDFLDGFQKKAKNYSDNDIRDLLKNGAEKARPLAAATMDKAKKALGL